MALVGSTEMLTLAHICDNHVINMVHVEGPDSDFGQGPIVMNLERFGEPTREWLGAGTWLYE